MKIDSTLDLRGVQCPMNWVQAKLRLEDMAPGEILEMLLDDGAPVLNVPRTARAEGHRIVEVKQDGDSFRVVVERGADE